MVKIGFTGTRYGMTESQDYAVAKLINILRPSEAHHGDCIGADARFHQLIELYQNSVADVRIIIHPPINSTRRAYCESDFIRDPRHYVDRNRNIVQSADVLIAAPREMSEQPRGGTWSTVRYAEANNKPVIIVLPNGTVAKRGNVYKCQHRELSVAGFCDDCGKWITVISENYASAGSGDTNDT